MLASIHFTIKKKKMYLFILGCAGSSLPGRLLSSCSKWALLSRHGLLTAVPSRVEHKLRSIRSVAVVHVDTPRQVGSSQTRDRTLVSCTGTRILYY